MGLASRGCEPAIVALALHYTMGAGLLQVAEGSDLNEEPENVASSALRSGSKFFAPSSGRVFSGLSALPTFVRGLDMRV
jgi:hypothetical protein